MLESYGRFHRLCGFIGRYMLVERANDAFSDGPPPFSLAKA